MLTLVCCVPPSLPSESSWRHSCSPGSPSFYPPLSSRLLCPHIFIFLVTRSPRLCTVSWSMNLSWQSKANFRPNHLWTRAHSSQARVSAIQSATQTTTVLYWFIASVITYHKCNPSQWFTCIIWNKAVLPGAQIHNCFSRLEAYSYQNSLLTKQNLEKR